MEKSNDPGSEQIENVSNKHSEQLKGRNTKTENNEGQEEIPSIH